MQLLPDGDRAFALTVGSFVVLLFVLAVSIVSATSPSGVGRLELAGFVVGFALFIGIYVVSMSADRVLKGDDKEQS